jgi:hypothetical protein
MEEKLAKFSARMISGSFIVIGMVFLLMFAIPMLISGELELGEEPFIIKMLIVASLYLVSTVLLATLPRKSFERRSFSWGFSIIFHVGFLYYLGVENQIGGAVFVIGIAETTILTLSIWGFSLMAYDYHKSR